MAIRRFENTPETSDIKALAQKIGFHHLETVDLEDLETDLIRGLPLSLAREQQFLPLWKLDDGLVV